MSYVPASRAAWSRSDDYSGPRAGPSERIISVTNLRPWTPVPPACNLTYCGTAYAEFCGDSGVLYAQRKHRTDRKHPAGRKPRPVMRSPAGGRGASFPASIRHVIRIGSEEQMGRVHAGRIVAGMQYQEPVWDRPISADPRESVSHYDTPAWARKVYAAVLLPANRRTESHPYPFKALPGLTGASIEPFPESGREVGRDRDMIPVSHGEPPTQVPMVRLGEALTRLPGRSYFSRGAQ